MKFKIFIEIDRNLDSRRLPLYLVRLIFIMERFNSYGKKHTILKLVNLSCVCVCVCVYVCVCCVTASVYVYKPVYVYTPSGPFLGKQCQVSRLPKPVT